MAKMKALVCRECGKEYPTKAIHVCEMCFGPLEVEPRRATTLRTKDRCGVLRGGSWLAPESSLHTSHRFWNQPDNNSYGVGLGFRCAKSAQTVSDEAVQTGRDAFILALVAMGAEKHTEALAAIEKALASDPDNKEYVSTRELIKKSNEEEIGAELTEGGLRPLPMGQVVGEVSREYV